MKQACFALLMLLAAGVFSWLGIWQVERRAWKLELIEQTQLKLAAEPVEAPAPALLPHPGPTDAYTKVRVTGHYLAGKDVFVVASTQYGRGFWVMTPLQVDGGFTVFVNRGFVTSAQKTTLVSPEGPITVTGLIRITEPNGSVLQSNKPMADKWYSRDVKAMAERLKLGNVAPYFIDAFDTGVNVPVSGLTVVQFRNNHLQYALTWFGLALLSLVGFGLVVAAGRTR